MNRDPMDEAISRLSDAVAQLDLMAKVPTVEWRKQHSQHLKDIATDLRKARQIVESQK